MSEFLAVVVGMVSFVVVVFLWCLAEAGGIDDDET